MTNSTTSIREMINQLSSPEFSMDESTFVRFCRRTFESTDVVNGKNSSAYLFRTVFDSDGDGNLNTSLEKTKFSKWLDNLLAATKSALIVVDVQNDFIDGSLSLKSGPAGHDPISIIDPINRLIDTVPFDLIVYTYDWHPPNHVSFLENVDSRRVLSQSNGSWKSGDTVTFVVNGGEMKQRVWPTHCVQNTTGSELHSNLRILNDPERVLRIYKGQDPNVDSYSAFFDNDRKGETYLHRELSNRGITDLYVCGLAYDVCVGWTAEDALKLGYRTAIVDDCARGLDSDEIDKIKENTRRMNGAILESNDISNVLKRVRIPWGWACSIAFQC